MTLTLERQNPLTGGFGAPTLWVLLDANRFPASCTEFATGDLWIVCALTATDVASAWDRFADDGSGTDFHPVEMLEAEVVDYLRREPDLPSGGYAVFDANGVPLRKERVR